LTKNIMEGKEVLSQEFCFEKIGLCFNKIGFF